MLFFPRGREGSERFAPGARFCAYDRLVCRAGNRGKAEWDEGGFAAGNNENAIPACSADAGVLEAAEKPLATQILTSAAKAAIQSKAVIAALKSCTTQNLWTGRLFPQHADEQRLQYKPVTRRLQGPC